jgi:hypothetical protein
MFATSAQIDHRNSVRISLVEVWAPIVNAVDRDIFTEAERMFKAAGLDTHMTFEEFQQIDRTCMGHIDWFNKLTLRIADKITGLDQLQRGES